MFGYVYTDKLLVFVSSCPLHESNGYCKKLSHVHAARAFTYICNYLHPGKLRCHWKTNGLKMYLPLKMVIEHCHASFRGCAIFICFLVFLGQNRSPIPQNNTSLLYEGPSRSSWIWPFCLCVGWVMLDSEEKIVIKPVYRGLSPKDSKYEDILLLAGLQIECCMFLLTIGSRINIHYP